MRGSFVIHSLSLHRPNLQPGAPCPGEIRYVFDGGTLTTNQVGAIRVPREELSEFAFLETRHAVQRTRHVDRPIVLGAHRARLAHLADGRHFLAVPPLDRHDVHIHYRPVRQPTGKRQPGLTPLRPRAGHALGMA